MRRETCRMRTYTTSTVDEHYDAASALIGNRNQFSDYRRQLSQNSFSQFLFKRSEFSLLLSLCESASLPGSSWCRFDVMTDGFEYNKHRTTHIVYRWMMSFMAWHDMPRPFRFILGSVHFSLGPTKTTKNRIEIGWVIIPVVITRYFRDQKNDCTRLFTTEITQFMLVRTVRAHGMFLHSTSRSINAHWLPLLLVDIDCRRQPRMRCSETTLHSFCLRRAIF